VAVRVARENVEADGAENIVCGVSDLLKSVDIAGGLYDFVVANIVSDVIIRLLPDVGDYMTKNGRMIVSGIISPRAPEVREAIAANGFRVVEERQENDWLAILIEKAS
jgi:ribosomal protein L11 methyltransferase